MNHPTTSKQNDHEDDHDKEISDLNLSAYCDESVLELMDNPFNPNTSVCRLRTDYKYNGFDSSMGSTWIYPTNYPVRQYQFNISRVSLFKNTLVVLPTGLGKTFIASVVMYNIFRWYPKGKVIFMAPTRPLVAQQINACYQIMGFPKDETVELTGKQNKKIRAIAWQTKRVFYCTPQVVWSDMNDNEINFPIADIKLIVVDEAHKAKGKYAYTEVVQSIWSRNKMFRVLALSATPGRVIKDVAEVVQNLLISNIEVRRENSIDVAPYVFKKNIKTIVVPLNDYLNGVRNRLLSLIEPYVKNLSDHQVISGGISNLTKAWLLFDRGKFRENTLTNRHPQQSNIMSDFSVCIGMYHALELLERHGIRVFLNYFDESGSGNAAEEKFFVMKDSNIRQFINDVRAESSIVPISDQDMSFYGGNVSIVDSETIDFGHPKFEILQKCLLEHFEANEDTKAIVFCEYRESVFLINRMLLSNRPLIKPRVFVGQGSTHNRTITQKEQIAIMNDFRSGKCNTLIATCVAEEGIDVGEVDFIVCFDVNNKNPIRFVQRIGRTGRKRQGKVMMLVTEGKEHQMLKEILATKDGINQRIGKSNEVNSVLCKEAPRLVPPEFNPQCIETFIEIKNTQPTVSKKTKPKKPEKQPKRNKQSTKTPKKETSKNIRKFFKPVEFDDQMDDDFDLSTDNMNLIREPNETNVNEIQNEIDEPIVNECSDPSKEQTSEIPIEMKLKTILDRYCDIQNKRMQSFDEFGERIPPPKINTNELPPILKQFYLRSSMEKTDAQKVSWQMLENERKLNLFKLMSQLKGQHEKSNESVEKSEVDESKCDDTSEEENINDEVIERSSVIDSQMPYLMETEGTSKYASQLEFQPQCEKLPVAQNIASSTPHKALITDHFVNTIGRLSSPITSSPLLKPSEQRKRRSKNFLQFLGLRTIHDLFSDPEDEIKTHPNPTDEIKSQPEQQNEEIMNVDKPIPPENEFEEEESQYTVSRILKICEAAEKEEIQQKDTSNETTNRKRRLNVGSVRDLFADEDDDDDFVQTSKYFAVAKNVSTSSNDTIIYDVDDSLFNQKPSASTPLKLNQEPRNNTVRLVTGQKSDDLFSTYNESTNNMSKTKNENHAKSPSTPKKPATTNTIVYQCGSPSLLNRSLNALTANLSRCFNETNSYAKPLSSTNSANRLPAEPTSILSEKLEILNSQLSTSRLLEEFDEIKENFASPFATCRTTTSNNNNNNNNKSHLGENSLNNHYGNDVETNCDTDITDDDVFATCKLASPLNKKSNRRKKKTKRRKLHFIDDEAAVSGDDDTSDDEFIASQMTQMNVTEHIDEGDPSVDIQAKYLQSIRSPINRRNFRIPNIGYRNPIATQNIFSQYVPPDESKYEEDSFVVGSDEELTSESGSESTDFDEITLVSTSKNRKRKSDDGKKPVAKKRRRIVQMSSDSD